MQRVRDYILSRPHVALSLPAVLSFISFITNFVAFIKDGVLDHNEIEILLQLSDGFQAVLLFILTLVLRDKK